MIQPKDFSENVFHLIGDEWMLVGAADGERSNMMTASWGGVGVLWGKNVCFVFIRHSRYTYEIIEKSDFITLSFFDENYRSALALCGKKSGRDIDKAKVCGLTKRTNDGFVTFDEARITVKAKKLFESDFAYDNFIDKSLIEKFYSDNDYHRMYVCEILEMDEK